jgi:transcriptional regulator with XRE-family HTH domain
MKTTGFGYFLRDIRENAKISLRKLAQETKLDPAYLSRLERELNPVMDFPNLGRNRLGEQNGNVLLPPFCMESNSVTVVPRYFKVTREVTDPEDFCSERDALFTQIRRETEIGIIMVILPKEKLIWLNSTGWF